jgi:general stress protein 26
MDAALRTKILSILRKHRLMSLATLRPDGWPQATTVGYASKDLFLYFLCDAHSQKAQNLAHDRRVSLTINRDAPNPMVIEGLSMAAHATLVEDRSEIMEVFNMLMAEYPEYAGLPTPDPDTICVFRLAPLVISVLDYTKGFGHSDLVHCAEEEGSRDLRQQKLPLAAS